MPGIEIPTESLHDAYLRGKREAAAEIERLRTVADNFLHEQTDENAKKLAAVLGGFPVRIPDEQYPTDRENGT